jgi:membrane protein DedA with SNARE-associated domain
MNYLDLLNTFSPVIAYFIVLAILFAESGLLVGFFLPGDSLIFPLGLLASQGHFSFLALVLFCTAAPTLAGVARMEYKTFLTYNVAGGAVWSMSLLALGYFLGRVIPNIDHYLLPFIGLTVVVSLISPLKHGMAYRWTEQV